MKPIPYGRHEILEEDKQAVLRALDSSFLTQGPLVEEFEKNVCQKVQAEHGIAVINGTAGLHLAALALGVTAGHRVLVPANTFAASANCIRYCGGDVEFIDIDPKSHCLDLNLLEQKLSNSNKGTFQGVVAVDFAGFPVDLERLRKIADQHGLWIIEDACHAIGARFLNSQKEWVHSGSSKYADASIFSFHPVKHIATGEGGMVTTQSASLAARIRSLRTHGITKDPSKMTKVDGPWYYEMQELGFNYRIPDLLCALGTSQLKRLDENLRRRRELAAQYRKALAGVGDIKLPQHLENWDHAYHLFVIQTQFRDKLFAFLNGNQIFPQVHYIPVYHMPYYRQIYGSIRLENCENYYRQSMSLPMFHSLSNADQERVIFMIQRFFNEQQNR